MNISTRPRCLLSYSSWTPSMYGGTKLQLHSFSAKKQMLQPHHVNSFASILFMEENHATSAIFTKFFTVHGRKSCNICDIHKTLGQNLHSNWFISAIGRYNSPTIEHRMLVLICQVQRNCWTANQQTSCWSEKKTLAIMLIDKIPVVQS